MDTKHIAVIAIYKEMSGLAAVDPTGVSATVVILIGAVLLTRILISD